jgi:molybdenum cofactor cytidylyltransferase
MRTPKALLDWQGTTLVEYQVNQLRAAGLDHVFVVVGPDAGRVMPLVKQEGGRPVLNERYAEGRASSVRAGAEALPDDVGAIVVQSVDEPRPSWVLRQLIEAHETAGKLIVVPTHQGTRGHPTVVDASLQAELRLVREATQGLREIVERHAADVHEVAFATAVVLLGMNTPEEYEEAKVRYTELASE